MPALLSTRPAFTTGTAAPSGTAPVAESGTSSNPGSRPAIPALLPVTGHDLQVPLVDGRWARYANLDCAASAPALQAVADHVAQVLPHYASVHRGAGYASQVCTSLYESSRAAIARFVQARPDDVVVITRNTTDALNLLASAVPGDGEVLFLDLEHHANLLPWAARRHRRLPVADTLGQTLDQLSTALREHPVALVAVTGASNVTGELIPVADVVRIAHAHGARVAVDAAQLAPHRPVDLAGWGVDYLALSGHKLYAPFGAGALIGRPDWLDAAPPYLPGGGAVREVGPERTTWAPAPQRHEGGTPNVLGAAALAQACRTLAALPDGALAGHEAALVERLIGGLAGLPGVEVLRIWPDSTERVGVVGFTVAGHDPGLVAAYLSAEHGIGVRDGRFCAHPLLARLGHPEGAIRASVGAGSSSDDVDRLVAALAAFLADGPAWRYAPDAGRWAPSPDPRPRVDWLPDADADASTGFGASPCQS